MNTSHVVSAALSRPFTTPARNRRSAFSSTTDGNGVRVRLPLSRNRQYTL